MLNKKPSEYIINISKAIHIVKKNTETVISPNKLYTTFCFFSIDDILVAKTPITVNNPLEINEMMIHIVMIITESPTL